MSLQAVLAWLANNVAQALIGLIVVTIIAAIGTFWRVRVNTKRARKSASDEEARAIDASIARHNQRVAFLEQSPPEAQRVLARFVDAKSHTLALDALDPAVALLQRQGVLIRGPRTDGSGFIVLNYFTVKAEFWQVMFNHGGHDAAHEIDPADR